MAAIRIRTYPSIFLHILLDQNLYEQTTNLLHSLALLCNNNYSVQREKLPWMIHSKIAVNVKPDRAGKDEWQTELTARCAALLLNFSMWNQSER